MIPNLKRYTHSENTVVPENEAIRIKLGDTFLHYCFHPDQGTYIRIKNPNKEQSAKYIVLLLASNILWKQDIRVLVLLAFTVQKAAAAAKLLQTSTKEAPTEEALAPRVLDYRCYMDLVQTIIDNITTVTNKDITCVKADNEVDAINAHIDFMRERNVNQSVKDYLET